MNGGSVHEVTDLEEVLSALATFEAEARRVPGFLRLDCSAIESFDQDSIALILGVLWRLRATGSQAELYHCRL